MSTGNTQLWQAIFVVLFAALLGAVLALSSGCALIRDNPNQRVVACIQLKGPPPGGTGTMLIVPSESTQEFSFDADCKLK